MDHHNFYQLFRGTLIAVVRYLYASTSATTPNNAPLVNAPLVFLPEESPLKGKGKALPAAQEYYQDWRREHYDDDAWKFAYDEFATSMEEGYDDEGEQSRSDDSESSSDKGMDFYETRLSQEFSGGDSEDD
jgi:hypothetical protein